VHQVGLSLHVYADVHGQQNIKFNNEFLSVLWRNRCDQQWI